MKNFVAGTVNATVLAAMIATGAFHYGTAAAEPHSIEDTDIEIVTDEELHCLQQNIYFEAGNQSTLGQVAVAWVTLNRVDSDRYPNSICKVVWQRKQFSWTHDGKPDSPAANVLEQRAWEDAGLVAEVALLDWAQNEQSPIDAATMFHADYVTPYWTTAYDQVVQIDTHIFYQ